MGALIFNGISTRELGLVIQAPPSYEFPEKDYESVHIPGKSGDVIISKGSYKNVNRKYYLASVFREGGSFVNNASAIASWLHSANGYARLEDSYEPEYYRLAAFSNSGEMNNLYNKATVLEVSFNCKPQRYLISGDEYYELSNINEGRLVLHNPTMFNSKPEFVFNTAGKTVTIYVYNHDTNVLYYSATFTVPSDGCVFYSELMDFVGPNGQSLNRNVQMPSSNDIYFPKGNVRIEVSGLSSNQKILLKPRWWTL